jgi:general stress protein CsbA
MASPASARGWLLLAFAPRGVSRFFSLASISLIENKGIRRFFLSLIHVIFDRVAPQLIAALLLFFAVAASASRGGFAAMFIGFIDMAAIAVGLARGPERWSWSMLAISITLVPSLGFILINNEELGRRFAAVLYAALPMIFVLNYGQRRSA